MTNYRFWTLSLLCLFCFHVFALLLTNCNFEDIVKYERSPTPKIYLLWVNTLFAEQTPCVLIAKHRHQVFFFYCLLVDVMGLGYILIWASFKHISLWLPKGHIALVYDNVWVRLWVQIQAWAWAWARTGAGARTRLSSGYNSRWRRGRRMTAAHTKSR